MRLNNHFENSHYPFDPMTLSNFAKLFISLPGTSSYQVYKEAPSSELTFCFTSFNTLLNVDIPVVATDDEKVNFFFKTPEESGRSLDKEEYIDLVKKAVDEIQRDRLGKIVLSRHRLLEKEIDPVGLFKKLAQTYPDACVYLFSHPATGTWMGATPETLIKKDGTQVLSMSLAGTQKKGEEHKFGEKEEQEQQMVTNFIEETFKSDRGLKEVEALEADVVPAGNLSHRRTMIRANATDRFHAPSLLGKLHPTPAVGGWPEGPALEFIQKNEDYHRSFYTGYFGLTNGTDFHYFVNLRCMQLFEKSMALYAGGGITKDSNPEAEWKETEAKMATLLKVIES